jgi:hypothetical protein
MRRVSFVMSASFLTACGLLVDTSGLDTGGPPVAPSNAVVDASSDAGGLDGLVRDDGCTSGGISDDPKNCGACGHDCLAGACAGQACQPFVVLDGLTGARGVFVEGDTLFYSLPKQIRVLTISTGVSAPIATVNETPVHLAVGPLYVYAGTEEGPVIRVPRGGGLEDSFISCTTDCSGVALHGNIVYTADRGTGASGVVFAKSIGGGPTWVAATTFTGPEDLDVDDQGMLVADEWGDQVRSAGIDGGASADFLTVRDPVSVVIDGARIFITSQSDGKVYTAARDGTGLRVIATGQHFPTGLTVSSVAIYWGDRERIMGLAK